MQDAEAPHPAKEVLYRVFDQGLENDLEKVSGSLSIAYGETGDRRAKGTTRLRGGVFVVIPEIS